VVRLPSQAQPETQDFITIVKAGAHQAAAKALVASVLSASGQAKLKSAGFGKP
jgi:ABC-type molybdate transport system substrate-binding protein